MRILFHSLLVLSLLTAHVVAPAHTHEVGELPVDHHARPHIHLHEHLHDHEHEHGHVHHGHDHAQEIDETVRGLLRGLCPADHDDGAIYVEQVSSVPANAESRADAVGEPDYVAIAAVRPDSVGLSPPDEVAEPPPRIRIDGPPLYLRNLSLRI